MFPAPAAAATTRPARQTSAIAVSISLTGSACPVIDGNRVCRIPITSIDDDSASVNTPPTGLPVIGWKRSRFQAPVVCIGCNSVAVDRAHLSTSSLRSSTCPIHSARSRWPSRSCPVSGCTSTASPRRSGPVAPRQTETHVVHSHRLRANPRDSNPANTGRSGDVPRGEVVRPPGPSSSRSRRAVTDPSDPGGAAGQTSPCEIIASLRPPSAHTLRRACPSPPSVTVKAKCTVS